MIMSGIFYSLVFAMECQQKKVTKKSSAKKGKRRCKGAFFKDTSNYFSLLNLKSLIERFGSLNTCGKENWKNSSSTLRWR